MTRKIRWLVLMAIMPLLALTVYSETELEWRDFPTETVELNGLPWFQENSPDLFRLPKRVQAVVRPPVWGLAQNTSGARIRFKSNTSTVGIRLEYPHLSGMKNMHAFGQSGVDLYVDGRYMGTALHDDKTEVEKIFTFDLQPAKREFVFYLPLYNGVSVKAIGLPSGVTVEPPRPFAVPKPVVFYGTSITQGGCASRSGMSYEAILCRNLNLDFVNLGFSGNGKGEKEVAETVAEIDASCFVLDFMANNRTEAAVQEVYEPFVRILREKHPTTPIVAVTIIYVVREENEDARREIRGMRDVARQVVAKMKAEGDGNIVLVEGHDLLGPDDADGLVDGTHPNDLGFQRMAERLAPTITQILNLPPR